MKNILVLLMALCIYGTPSHALFRFNIEKPKTEAKASSNVITTRTENQKISRFKVLKSVVAQKIPIIQRHKNTNRSNTAGISSLIFGIIATLGIFGGIPFLWILAIPAVITGIIGLKDPQQEYAIAGLVLGSLEILLFFVVIAIVAAWLL